MTYEEKVHFIFQAMDAAGVSMTDFSRITSISRETLYRWKSGGSITDKLRLDLAYTVALRFEKACRAGRLPLVDRLKAPARVKLIKKIIADMASV